MSPRPLSPPWLRALMLIGVSVLLSVVVWWPMIKAYPGTPIEDGHYFFHQVEISRAAIFRYHELPLWNPFDCRGIPMWDHPENITASPIFYLTLPFNSSVMIIVWNIAHVALGFCGMWLLSRSEFKVSRAAAFVASAAWAFGTVHNQYAGEHEAFVSFYNIPMLLFLWRRAETSWNFTVGTGLFIALMLYDGATYALPFGVLTVGVETLTRLTSLRRATRIAAAAAVVGVVGVAVGAGRIFTLLDQFAAHERVMEADWDKVTQLQTWVDMYLLRSPHWRARVAGQQYAFGEYQAYIGWLGLLLLFLGVLSTIGETTWMLFVSGVLVVLIMGRFAPWAPWPLLQRVQPFKATRVAARFRLILAMFISAYMALAVDRVPAIVRRLTGKVDFSNALRVALVAMAMFAVGDNAGLFTEILEVRFQGAPLTAAPSSARFYYGGSDLSGDFINHPRQNHAYLGCRAGWAYHADAALWTGDVPQARAVDSTVKVEAVSRTHNSFTIDLDAAGPGDIVLNSAYEKNWRSNIGATFERAHTLAIHVPQGRHQLHVQYRPRLLTLGLWVSGLSLIAAIAFFARGRIKRVLARDKIAAPK